MFSHLPQLNSIRVFEAAARLSSFKAAAEELNVTPTAISHQIRNLEEKLGTLLFERKTRAIALTPEGLQLAQVSYQALQQIASILEDISGIQTVVTVATTSSFAAMWLVPRLARFQKRHPEIQVEIKTGEQLDDLQKDRRIDLAIRYGQNDEQNENAIKLITEYFGVYATRKYLKDCKSLKNATLIETQWQNKRLPPVTWKHWLQKYGVNAGSPQIRYFDQEHHVIQAALAGQGIALISSVLVQAALQQSWLQPYKDDCCLPGLTYYLLPSPFSKDLRKVAVFQDWLVEELEEYS
ncbi:MAG: LysR family transcriptional regulator [Gammaproteobacteria bacterium]|nr:LysR family transcriptional regulator [Gammaproteobacteria bacterium]